MNEAEARLWLCTQIPDLRRSAQTGGWSAALDDALAVLDEGGTALDVVALLNPDEPVDERGDNPFLPFGTYDIDVAGDYICPTGWCPRRAGRDDRGRPPWCELRRRPMRFTEP